jgi:hypothetical protein
LSDKRRTGRINLSKLCCPTAEGKCVSFKGEFGAQLGYMRRRVFTMAASLDSPGVWHHFSEAVCLGGQRELRAKRLPGLNEEQRG